MTPHSGGLVPASRIFEFCFKSIPSKENDFSANLPHDNSLVTLTLTLIYSFCTHTAKKEELYSLNTGLEKATTNFRVVFFWPVKCRKNQDVTHQ